MFFYHYYMVNKDFINNKKAKAKLKKPRNVVDKCHTTCIVMLVRYDTNDTLYLHVHAPNS